jgi:hypothetical protein
MFLRGLPHLCKMMKRKPVTLKKHVTDAQHEPDLFKISEHKPVPERSLTEDSILHCTLQGGPKARMPIFQSRHHYSTKSVSSPSHYAAPSNNPITSAPALVPQLRQNLPPNGCPGESIALRPSERTMGYMHQITPAAAAAILGIAHYQAIASIASTFTTSATARDFLDMVLPTCPSYRVSTLGGSAISGKQMITPRLLPSDAAAPAAPGPI